MGKGKIIVYDLCGCPDAWKVSEILNFFKDSNFIVWDSAKTKYEPKVIDLSPDCYSLDTSKMPDFKIIKEVEK